MRAGFGPDRHAPRLDPRNLRRGEIARVVADERGANPVKVGDFREFPQTFIGHRPASARPKPFGRQPPWARRRQPRQFGHRMRIERHEGHVAPVAVERLGCGTLQRANVRAKLPILIL